MNKKIMRALADLTELQYDNDQKDTRLFYDNERINVFANLMSKNEYNKMCKALDKTIKGEGYLVYAWNDSSSYDYWKNQGESGDSNYIQVTVDVQDLNKVDPDKMKADAIKLFKSFLKYDNLEEYYAKKAN